jgi:membrane protein implicated in regulation of membrane protease activity
MIRTALTFFLLALGVSLLGATNAGGMTTEFGHFLLLVFLVLSCVAFSRGILKESRDNENRRREFNGRRARNGKDLQSFN